MKNILKLIWIGCCLAVLITTLYFHDGSNESDAPILLIYGMLFLSFPIGYLAALVVGGMIELGTSLGYNMGEQYWLLCIAWLIYLAFGYFQWFKLVPVLIDKSKTWLKSRSSK